MEDKQLKYRMYFLVMYNLSPIQQGIQAGHVALEYVEDYRETKEYQDFFEYDKTWIVLSGGTSSDMLEHYNYLNNELKINVSYFLEPDLNNSMSAICFLADERVWDKEQYPDIDKPETYPVYFAEYNKEDPYLIINSYEDWVKMIGGEQNVKLREFLKGKRLA